MTNDLDFGIEVMKDREWAKKGFTLIELIIVIAIIGILAGIVIPAYIGLQDMARRGVITRIVIASKPELQAWIHSVRKAGTTQGELREVDTNNDGTIDEYDLTNNDLANAGLVTTWIRYRKDMRSPWNSAVELWADGGNDSQCETVAPNGRITLCYTPAENATIQALFIVVKDKGGGVLP